MPPGNSQKGTGKKGAGIARQRSRNTTPSSLPPPTGLPPTETVSTEYLTLQFDLFRNISLEDLLDHSGSSQVIPDSKSLDVVINRLEQLHKTVDQRNNHCDRGMRELATHRKQRAQDYGRMDEERDKPRPKTKKRKERPDSLAPQDQHIERSSPLRESSSKPRKLARDNDSASSSLSPVAPATPGGAMEVDEKTKVEDDNEDESSSDDGDGRPPPPAAPQFQTFGEDPSIFPDPTVYEIRDVAPGMSEEEIKEIYSVARYPRSDLADMIAGDPPDKDFSSAKPSNQISFSTFSTYIEPYFRPFAEEDLGFLRERGDRVGPFLMPKRGKKHYTEVWADEDGAMNIDSSPNGRDRLPPNQARGNIESMDDDVAETDKLSVGPLVTRLLQAMRPESRAPPSEDRPATNGLNGDSMMGDMNGDLGDPSMSVMDDLFKMPPIPPAAYMNESSTEAWKKASHPKLDYSQVDERIKQELRHIGFLPLEGGSFDSAEYDGHYDDEVAGRLRLLQDRLRQQMLINGARKTRLTELVKERMAHQEYQTILEDLDTQVQQAYLKRTRTMGKNKKSKRPGGAGGGSHFVGGNAAGMARPGIGDMTKTLMERRKRWIENIGTVFEDPTLGKVPRSAVPNSSIFKPSEMTALMNKEKEAWDEDEE